jgi:hypothetical protein
MADWADCIQLTLDLDFDMIEQTTMKGNNEH